MNTLEVLKAARAKIALPEWWIKNVMSADVFNDPVPPCHERASCWCARGAIRSVLPVHPSTEAEIRRFLRDFDKALNAVKEAAGVQNIENWNDAPERTHAEVLAAFDKAIETEESKCGI